MADATTTQGGTSTARTLTVLAFVFGAVSILFLPIIFGPAAIVCGAIAWSKGDPLARYALPFAIVAMILGFVLGAIVFSATNDDALGSAAAAASVLAPR